MMAQSKTINIKQKNLTSCQTSTNNRQFNHVLSPTRRNVQYRFDSNIDKTNYPNIRIHRRQLSGERLLLPTKKLNKISSSTSCINEIKENQESDIHIDLRRSSNRYSNSQTERRLSLFSNDEKRNDSKSFSSQPKFIQRGRSSHLIESNSLITRECSICLLDQSLNQFKECYSNECKHLLRTICDTCIYNYIKSLLENLIIYCPELNCSSIFHYEIIRYILTIRNNLELFERYDRLLTHQHLEQNQEFIWCAHNQCGSGQFHDKGRNSNPMVNCIKCKKLTCAFHRIKWHIGITCEEYDQRKKLSNDDKTQIWLKKYSKNCPQCYSYIQKISGCDHMTCKRCKYQFCWECGANYQNIQIYGLKQHIKDCSHHPNYYRSIYRQQTSTTCNIL